MGHGHAETRRRRWIRATATVAFGLNGACATEVRDADDPTGPGPATSGTADDDGGASSSTPTGDEGGVSTAADDDSGGGTKLDVGSVIDLGDIPTAVTCDDVERLPSNQGCEFWAVDLPNVSVISPPGVIVPPSDQQFAVVVSNPSDEVTAAVEIFEGASGTSVDAGPVPPATMRVFSLPALSIPPAMTGATGSAYRIDSDQPIVAYQFQPLDNSSPVYSNDATILFPTHVLDGDYSAITADATLVPDDGFSSSDDNTGAFVSVVGTEDGTTITLYPTAGLHPGSVTDVVIDRGQVFTAISSERGAPGYGNLSGTRVVADAPVAVFAGSVATSEPSAAAACCADHVEHQMLPLTAWGSSYVAAPTPAATGAGNDASLFRITGAFDGTTLSYEPAPPPGAPTQLAAYETVSFVSDASFTVRSDDDADSFAVAQFLLSNQYFSPLLRPGDPTMIVLPATAQFQDRYALLVPQGYASNFVTVVRPAGAAVSLGGQAIAASFAAVGSLDGVMYEYAHVAVDGGSHALSGDEPFGVVVAGHAQDVSYGYVGGSGVSAIGTAPPPPG